jgi:hypothetical protein
MSLIPRQRLIQKTSSQRSRGEALWVDSGDYSSLHFA